METIITRKPLEHICGITFWKNKKSFYTLANHAEGHTTHPDFFTGHCLFSTATRHARDLIRWGQYLSIDIKTYIRSIDKIVTLANISRRDEFVNFIVPTWTLDKILSPYNETYTPHNPYNISEFEFNILLDFKRKVGDNMPIIAHTEKPLVCVHDDIFDSATNCVEISVKIMRD